jgi:hypothetical protein
MQKSGWGLTAVLTSLLGLMVFTQGGMTLAQTTPPQLENPDPRPEVLPASPPVRHELRISKACQGLLEFFVRQQNAIAERQVGFWEPGQAQVTLEEQRALLGLQREAVASAVQAYPVFELKYYLRGLVPTYTGWGNCGEHTATLWSELVERYQHFENSFLNCAGAKVFRTQVFYQETDVDHVWLEVWVPKVIYESPITLSYGEDEPLAIEGTEDGIEGYYLMMDATTSRLGPYHIVREMVFALHQRAVASLKDWVIDRRWLNPKNIFRNDIHKAHLKAKEIAAKVPRKETLGRSTMDVAMVPSIERTVAPLTGILDPHWVLLGTSSK